MGMCRRSKPGNEEEVSSDDDDNSDGDGGGGIGSGGDVNGVAATDCQQVLPIHQINVLLLILQSQ